MGGVTSSIENGATLEADAAAEVEAAVTELGRQGRFPLSIGLLLDALETERQSLESIEDSIDSLKIALDQRRQALDQQDEMLRDLADSLNKGRGE